MSAMRRAVLLLAIAGCGSHDPTGSADHARPVAPAPAVPVPAPAATPPPARALQISTAPIAQLALGGKHTCALHTDGAVSCWGANDNLQLGVRDRGSHAMPVRAAGAADAIQIAASDERTCLLLKSGEVVCWGRTSKGSTDLPTRLDVPPIAQISGACMRTRAGGVACVTGDDAIATIDGVTDATELAAHRASGCAITAAKRVTCWDVDRGGIKLQPAAVVAGVTDAVQVAVGDGFACARLANGHAACWGIEYYGRLGRGGAPKRPGPPQMHYVPPPQLAPAPVVDLADATSLVAGPGYACALRRDGTVACWGQQQESNGPGNMPVHTKPTTVPGLTGVTQIAAGRHACALRVGRDVMCWGADADGQLGNGWSSTHPTPIDVPGIDDAVALDDTCARRKNGHVACWGFDNDLGRYLAPHDVAGFEHTASGANTTAVDTEGRVWQIRDKRAVRVDVPAAVQTSPHCAVTTTGAVWCWAGDMKPHALAGIDDALAAFDGRFQTCVLRRSGAISCVFGSDNRDLATPRTLADLTDATQLAVGTAWNGVSCAIRKDRTVWCWWWDLDTYVHGGNNNVSPAAPVKPPAATGVTQAISIAVGYDAACAARDDGIVACWGANDRGQLGDGTITPHAQPAAVPGITDAIAVTAGYKHACALRRAGTVTCWGLAEHGAIGTAAARWIEQPVAVAWP
jgi:alpha-tubulin suppressor-like RCC1 family protein